MSRSLLVAMASAAMVFSWMAEARSDEDYIQILSTPPTDLPRDSTFEQQAMFAWQEFLALNYKALYDVSKAPGSRGARGTPDTTWNYGDQSTGAHPQTVVWETYAHRTELRPWFYPMKPFDNDPHYSFGQQANFIQGTNAGGQPADFGLLNMLDENNEIGRNYMFTSQDHENFILYQVKVNRDEYDYVLDTYPPTETSSTDNTASWTDLINAATNGMPTPAPTETPSTPNASLYYKGVEDLCNCPPDDKLICLPCGSSTIEGAIEVKAAFRRLRQGEDASQFFTVNATYFVKNVINTVETYTYNNDIFALIGIHIIHKTTNFPDFVYATWEHVSLEDPAGQYDYEELSSGDNMTPIVPIPGPDGNLFNPVVRLHPIDSQLAQINTNVHAQLTALNPKIVWQYYQLVGVQAAVDGALGSCTLVYNPTSVIPNEPPPFNPYAGMQMTTDPNACINLTNDPNYYLANFVIESDLGFAPARSVPGLMTFNGSGFNPFPLKDGKNILYKGDFYNFGGCKGCHGVAQLGFGTDFSFLLDSGNGKPTDAPDYINADDPTAAALHIGKTRKAYMK